MGFVSILYFRLIVVFEDFRPFVSADSQILPNCISELLPEIFFLALPDDQFLITVRFNYFLDFVIGG